MNGETPILGRTITKTYFYDGLVSNSLFNGFGQLYTFSDKTFFSGTFKNGAKYGPGTTYSKGKSVKGLWFNDIYMGEYSIDLENEMRLYMML